MSAMEKILGPWMSVYHVDYQIRSPVELLQLDHMTILANMVATAIPPDRSKLWGYFIFINDQYPRNNIRIDESFHSEEEAQQACDNHLIGLGYTLLTEEQVKKIEILL